MGIAIVVPFAEGVVEQFWWLLVAHAVTDLLLQNERMALLKSRLQNPLKGDWVCWMAAHALINGAGVVLITGVWWLGLAETVWHGLTDTLKTEKKIGLLVDQTSHLVSKVFWAIL